MTRARILFAMVQAGDGHRAPAEALAAWLEREAPGVVDAEVVDFTLAVGDEALDAWHKGTWNRMLRAPWTAYWGQRLIDGVLPGRLTRAVLRLVLARHARHAAAWLARNPYDLIVCTHFFPAQALGIAARRHGVATPVVVVSSDALDAHVMWADRSAERYFVSSRPAADDLLRQRIEPQRISIVEPVLRPPFGTVCDDAERTEAREALDLDPDAFVVLWGSGGEGIGGRLPRVLDALDALEAPVHVLALCGRNEALLAALSEHAGRLRHARVTPLPFRRDVRRLLCASDLFVGKAGVSSTYEALASGVPVVHYGFIGANEKALSDWLIDSGAGARIEDPRDLAGTLSDLLVRPERLAILRRRVAELDIGNGGPDVARWLLHRVRGDRPPPGP